MFSYRSLSLFLSIGTVTFLIMMTATSSFAQETPLKTEQKIFSVYLETGFKGGHAQKPIYYFDRAAPKFKPFSFPLTVALQIKPQHSTVAFQIRGGYDRIIYTTYDKPFIISHSWIGDIALLWYYLKAPHVFFPYLIAAEGFQASEHDIQPLTQLGLGANVLLNKYHRHKLYFKLENTAQTDFDGTLFDEGRIGIGFSF